MTTAETDTDAIVTEPRALTLENGVEVRVERIRLRQLMRFLKILTRGAGGALSSLSLSEDSSQEEFATNILMATILAFPEAEDESVDFLTSMVSPAGLIEGKKLSKAEMEINDGKYQAVIEALHNPELDDTVAIITAIVEVEGPHIRSLGKQLATLLKAQKKSEVAKKPNASSKKTSNA